MRLGQTTFGAAFVAVSITVAGMARAQESSSEPIPLGYEREDLQMSVPHSMMCEEGAFMCAEPAPVQFVKPPPPRKQPPRRARPALIV